MAGRKYIIRAPQFSYDDEAFYTAGWQISDRLASREKAEAALRKRQLKLLANEDWDFEFDQLACFWNASGTAMAAGDRFVHERTGEHVFENWEELYALKGPYPYDNASGDEAALPESLDDDSRLEFARLVGMRVHQLLETDDDGNLYVYWLPGKDRPLFDYDEAGTFMSYAETPEACRALADEVIRDYGVSERVRGSAGELSTTPDLLEKLVESTRGVEWNEAGTRLEIGRCRPPRARGGQCPERTVDEAAGRLRGSPDERGCDQQARERHERRQAAVRVGGRRRRRGRGGLREEVDRSEVTMR